MLQDISLLWSGQEAGGRRSIFASEGAPTVFNGRVVYPSPLVSMRRACGTDANGRDWKQLDDLIEYAQGQEVRSRIASVKTGSLNLVQTPRLNFAKTPRPKILKKQAPPPRPRLKTCRECGNATQNFKKHTASGECERIKAARDAPLPHHNEFNMGRGNGNNGARGRNGYQGGRGASGDPMQH